MRIVQYFLMTDYSLWGLILNGDSPAPTRVVEGVVQPLKFNIHKDAKNLMEAIEKRFVGNKETKKVQKTLLKQQYKNFTGTSSESLDQIHDRLQKLIKEQNLDDLFNSLKIYEAEDKISSSASTSIQNIDFVSASNTDNTNEPVSAAASVSAVSAKIPVSALPNVDTLSNAVIYSFLLVNLLWTGRNLRANEPTSIGFDMSKVDCHNCHKQGHFVRECRSPKDTRRNYAADPQRRNVPVDTSISNALVSQCDGVGIYDWSFQAEEEPTNYALMDFTSSSSSSYNNEVPSCSKACTKAYATLQSHYDKLTDDFRKSQFDVISYKTGLEYVEAKLLVYQQIETVFEEDIKLLKLEVQLRDNALVVLRQKLKKAKQERDGLKLKLKKYQSGDGYHAVSPPYTGTFMPPKPNLVFHNALIDTVTVHTALKIMFSPTKPDNDLFHTHRPSSPIIEDWVSDSEEVSEAEILQNAPTLTKSQLVPITAARLVTAAVPKSHVTRPRPAKPIVTKPYSPPRRHINHSPSPKASTFHVKVAAVKVPQGNPQHTLKDKGVIDSGCSRHMTGNMSSLFDFEELNGGYVSFSGNPNGVRSLMCDKKNNVLFTDTECLILSPEFKLPDENQVLLRVHKENNMYNVDLKNIVPSGDMTCLFTKATLDESNLWHKRLGYINFKTMNKLVKGEESVQQYVLFPVWSFGSTHPQNTDRDAAFEVKEPEFEGRKPQSKVHVSLSSSAQSKKHDDKTKREAKSKILAVGQISTNSTNTFSAAGPSNDAVKLEDITYSDNDDDVGTEADFNNLETTITISPIPTTRVHKDHPVTQIIGDLSLATQTRSMTRVAKDQCGLSQINNDDFHTCMFACFISQEEPKREERIDYEEVFAPVARIEAIRLFLAYASFMGFMVYQMDVKSVFLYGTIEEEVYVCQPQDLRTLIILTSFQRGKIDQRFFIKRQKGDILLVQIYVDEIIFGFTNKHLCKAFEKLMKDKFQMSLMRELTFFLGLQVKLKKDGIFISQDTYVAEILKKFGLTDGKSTSTPTDTEKPLLKDADGEDVDVHIYRSMIGSLMYLTLSRPDIMFAVCACAHFQVTPKALHLHAVKKIFRYLKGKSYLGLWYPKDSPFNLVAYSDSDYDGASLDRKSTTRGCQFLGCRLISWQCKKQTVVATSSTEAEYIAAAS
uniref:Putative ribonuclease H-like domain-containing protein n=1 Tax=Tanacetum cinerariifolium TaxID=118510 RepID=A0A6L2L9K9_TANCI|nr:putative ribonuclease H-like domain-containing protein [Tanacetum cinerariifolium]